MAGNGSTSADSDDGAVVTAAPIGESLHIAVDAVGNVYYSDGFVVDNRAVRIHDSADDPALAALRDRDLTESET